MSRLQKKCFVGATSLHVLLLLALLVGPGFFNRPTFDDAPVMTIVAIPTDGASRGGTPPPAEHPQTPVVQQRQEQAQPAEQQAPQEQKPEKDVAPPEQPDDPTPRQSENIEPDAPRQKPRNRPTPHVVQISDKKVKTSNKNTTTKPRTSSNASSAANNALASAISKAGTRIRNGLSQTTDVDLPEGVGGGGVSYVNYGGYVRSKYAEAWRAPDDMTDDQAVIKVSVTIARDGTVLASEIIKSSGSAAADRSIQNTLDRIRNIGMPFPAGAKESQRTFILTFNLKARSAFG